MDAEVKALICENTDDTDVVIYTDGSVICHHRCAWAFTARSKGRTVHEASGAFTATTSSLTMEVFAVTQALNWLESQAYSHACILSDSLNMIQKVKTGDVRREWVESLERAKIRVSLRKLTLIFVPGHAGVEGNERANQLASLTTTTDGQPMDRADILIALCEFLRSEALR